MLLRTRAMTTVVQLQPCEHSTYFVADEDAFLFCQSTFKWILVEILESSSYRCGCLHHGAHETFARCPFPHTFASTSCVMTYADNVLHLVYNIYVDDLIVSDVGSPFHQCQPQKPLLCPNTPQRFRLVSTSYPEWIKVAR